MLISRSFTRLVGSNPALCVLPTCPSGKGSGLENRLSEMACRFKSYRWRMSKIDNNREIFTKVWNAYRAMPEPKTDADWKQLIDSMKEIRKKYNCPLADDLTVAIMNEIERSAK